MKRNPESQEWKEWLEERERLFIAEGLAAFDLFAPKAAALLEQSPWIQRLIGERFPLIIVDEAQDTGPDAWRFIEIVSGLSQVVCLADLEQQIFDHLPGIGPERLDSIKVALTPVEVNLGSENLRSPDSQIAEFGQDIISGRVRQGGYKGVSSLLFNRGSDLGVTLRRALGCLQREVRKETNDWAKTIAVLVPTAAEAARVSEGLKAGNKPVPHKLMFDEDEARLAARFAAYLLEPREAVAEEVQIAEALLLLCDLKKAAGSATAAKQLLGWAAKCKIGKVSTSGLVKVAAGLACDPQDGCV